MRVTLDNVRLHEGREAYLTFNLLISLAEVDIISVGWRLTRGRILAPSYRAGAFWPSTVYFSTELCQVIYDAVKSLDLKPYKGVESVMESFVDAVTAFRTTPEVVTRFLPGVKLTEENASK